MALAATAWVMPPRPSDTVTGVPTWHARREAGFGVAENAPLAGTVGDALAPEPALGVAVVGAAAVGVPPLLDDFPHPLEKAREERTRTTGLVQR
jgi:hypothetical protein